MAPGEFMANDKPLPTERDSRHEAGMRLQRQVTVPKIETDLSRIQELSAKAERSR
jgi:hypothetical protein